MFKLAVALATMLAVFPIHGCAQTSVRGASTSALLRRLAALDVADSHYSERDSILAELLRRRPVDQVIAAYNRPVNYPEAKDLLESVLYHLHDKRVTAFMRSLLSDSATFATYYAAMYLGASGDTTALSILNRHFGNWPVSSVQLSFTAKLFGRFKYRPSIDNLIDALQAASLNLAQGALVALRDFYPNSPQFRSAAEAVHYYRGIQRSKGPVAEQWRTPDNKWASAYAACGRSGETGASEGVLVNRVPSSTEAEPVSVWTAPVRKP